MIKLYKITICSFKDIHNITLKQNVQILPIIQTKINYHSKKKTTPKTKQKQKKIRAGETNQNYTQHFKRVWKRESH